LKGRGIHRANPQGKKYGRTPTRIQKKRRLNGGVQGKTIISRTGNRVLLLQGRGSDLEENRREHASVPAVSDLIKKRQKKKQKKFRRCA